jgi:hypothetical protein
MILPELSLWGKSLIDLSASHFFEHQRFLFFSSPNMSNQYLCFAGEFNVTLDPVSTLSRAKLPFDEVDEYAWFNPMEHSKGVNRYWE